MQLILQGWFQAGHCRKNCNTNHANYLPLLPNLLFPGPWLVSCHISHCRKHKTWTPLWFLHLRLVNPQIDFTWNRTRIVILSTFGPLPSLPTTLPPSIRLNLISQNSPFLLLVKSKARNFVGWIRPCRLLWIRICFS